MLQSYSSLTDAPLPDDILSLVIENLNEDRALHACTLVNRAFHVQATKLLYRSLNSRIVQRSHGPQVIHPATTIVERPRLARHVLEIHESDGYEDVHILSVVLQAIGLCTRLHTFVWSGSKHSARPSQLHSFLLALQASSSLRALTIHTTGALPDAVYSTLTHFTGLSSVTLWVMEGPPRYMQSWSLALGDTLVELTLGRCSGVPATLLAGTLAPLKQLCTLHIRGILSSAVPRIISRLPSLRGLDTDYVPSMMRGDDGSLRLPGLQRLSVTASSVDVDGPIHLWDWLTVLLTPARSEERRKEPHAPGLESFSLSAFALHGRLTVPNRFLMFLHREHRHSVRRFVIGETQLDVHTLQHLCSDMPLLEEVGCAVAATAASQVISALAPAACLRAVRLHVSWIHRDQAILPPEDGGEGPPLARSVQSGVASRDDPSSARVVDAKPVSFKDRPRFTAEDARQVMLRDGGSLGIRLITVNDEVYTGHWVLNAPSLDLKARSQTLLRESDFQFVVRLGTGNT